MTYDTALRIGSPTGSIEEASPYDGYQQKVRENSKNSMLSMVSMLKTVPDFDANKCKPVDNQPYSKRDEGYRDTILLYSKNLHDIHPSWIEHWIENMMYSVRYNDNGAEYLARSNFTQQNILVDNDEGTSAEEFEMQMDHSVDEISISQYVKYRKRAIYLVKVLSMLGARHGVHMMSLICAHERAKYLRASGNSGSINKNAGKAKQSEILQHGVYQCNLSGSPAEIEPGVYATWANKGEYSSWAHPFITGDYDPVDAKYYKDYLELLRLCYILDIDLRKEDASKYTAKTLNELAVVYIKGNSDYLNGSIIQSIRNSSLMELETAITIDEGVRQPKDMLKYSALKFRELLSVDRFIPNTKAIEQLLFFYKCFLGQNEISVDLNDYKYFEGFLAKENGDILTFDATPLLSIKMLSVGNKRRFMIHKTGVLVLITPDEFVVYTVPVLYTQYISTFIEYSEANGRSKQMALSGAKNTVRATSGIQYTPGNFGYGHWYKGRCEL